MTSDRAKQWALVTTRLSAGNVAAAIALSLVIDSSPAVIGATFLVLSLNVFAIPVVLATDIFTYPLWAWYIIVFAWVKAIAGIYQYHPDFADSGGEQA